MGQWPYAIAVSWGFVGIAVANMGSAMLLTVAAISAAVIVLCVTAVPRKSFD